MPLYTVDVNMSMQVWGSSKEAIEDSWFAFMLDAIRNNESFGEISIHETKVIPDEWRDVEPYANTADDEDDVRGLTCRELAERLLE